MEFLREFRLKEGLSQSSMAARVGVSFSFYSKIESGNKKPSRNFMARFKRAFPAFDMNRFFDEACERRDEG